MPIARLVEDRVLARHTPVAEKPPDLGAAAAAASRPQVGTSNVMPRRRSRWRRPGDGGTR
ncbi:MAG: hypothetical protein AVDCRST_MAG19-2384 [uncultured Thermomicrobiales bacterium]|uniref:Uncharacterized protein n=1 Tax=uncultured Thermomicrobiales bacterium TaxID=1645740 RepID=A0A6J4V396_9BACT|nr:MAG: hypothetical protein AVDCRST_MAG19-2384 [uncultured Thermomicrobiales bacterium]